MTNSSDTFWEVDGNSLQTYAFNIVTWGEDREAPPPLRGSNSTVAYRPGTQYHSKTPDSRTLSMGFWVQGSLEDGSAPSDGPAALKFQQNFKMLRRLLFQPRRQFTLTKKFYLYGDPTLYTASAKAEYAGGLNVSMNGTASGIFTIDLVMAEPYFYGDPIHLSLDPHNPEQDFDILGDDRALKIITTIPGATSRLRVANSTYDIFFDYTKPLPAGQTATVDNWNFQAKHNVGASNESSSTYVETSASDPFWFYLEPGVNTLSIEELDIPTQGVEWTNLATNPSFEGSSGDTTTVATNLVPNAEFGSAEVTGTQSTWRTNLFTNPNFYANTSGATAIGGSTLTRTSTQFHIGTSSLQVVTSGASGSGVSLAANADLLTTYLFCGAWIKAPAGITFNLQFSTTNTLVSKSYTGTGDWQWCTTDTSSASGALVSNGQFQIVQTISTSPITFYVNGVVIQKDAFIDEAFSGTTVDNHDGNGFNYAWTGATDASTSTKSTVLSELYRNLAPNPDFANDVTPASSAQTSVFTNLLQNPNNEKVQAISGQVRTNLITNPVPSGTTGWSVKNGATSLTLTTPAATQFSNIENMPATWLSATLAAYAASTSVIIDVTASARISVVAGSSYVFSIFTGTSSTIIPALGNTINIAWFNSSAALISTTSASFTPTVGSIGRQTVMGVAPAGAVTARLQVIFGSANTTTFAANTTFTACGALFEQAYAVNRFFSGASSANSNFAYAWSGTANASPSTETASVFVTRVNKCVTPNFSSSKSTIILQDSSSVNTLSATMAPGAPISTGVNMVLVSSNRFAIGQNIPDAVAGETYAVSAYAYSSRSTVLFFEAISLAGFELVGDTSGGSAIVPANTWVRFSYVFTVPANTSQFNVKVWSDATSSPAIVGDTLQLTAMQVEHGSAITPFFYDGTAANADYTYAPGKAAISPSLETVGVVNPVITGIGLSTPSNLPNGIAFGSALGAVSNSRSLAIAAVGGLGTDTYASLPTTGMISGHSYTVIARCFVAGGSVYHGPPGSPGPRALTIAPSNLATYTVHNAASAFGNSDFRASFTWDGSWLRAYNGYDQGVVYWDDISIVEIPDLDHPFPFKKGFFGTTGNVLPGTMTADSYYNDFYDGFVWNGTADASTTSFKILQPFGTNPVKNCLAVTSRTSGIWSFNSLSSDPTSLRLIATSLSSDSSYISPGGDSGALRLGLAAGNTYYINAFRSAPTSGLTNANAARMVLTYRVGGGSYIDVPDFQDPNLGSSHRVIIATLPAGTTEAYIRLYHGGVLGTGDVYWNWFGIRQLESAAQGTAMNFYPTVGSGDNVYASGQTVLRWSGTRWNSPTQVLAPLPYGAKASTNYASFAPVPYLRFPNGYQQTPSMSIDGGVPYTGKCVAVASGVTLSLNTTYTLRGSVTVSEAATTTHSTDNRAQIKWSTGAVTVVSETTVPNIPGTYDYTLVFTTPSTGTLSEIDLFFSQGGTSRVMSSWNRLLLVVGSLPPHPYAGGTVDNYSDIDLTSVWSGTPNQSVSLLTGILASTVTGVHAAAIQSTQNIINGNHSLRVIPTDSVSTDSYASIGGDAGDMRLGMVAGNTYTALVTISLGPAAQTSVSTYMRQFVVAYRTPSGYTYLPSSQIDNVPGARGEVRMTFSIPSNATEAFIRLYNGGKVGEADVWFDQFMLLQQGTVQSYAGPYFDGNTPDSDIANYEWTGPADASTSVIRGVASSQPVDISYQPAWI